MGIEKVFDVKFDLTDKDLSDFDKEIERGSKKLQSTRKKQLAKISKEQKQIEKIKQKDRESGAVPYLPGKGTSFTDKTSSSPLSQMLKSNKNKFEQAIEKSLSKILKGKLKDELLSGKGTGILGNISGIMRGGSTNFIAGLAQKIAPIAIAITVAASTKQILQSMQQRGGWLDRYVRDSINTLGDKLRDKHLTYSIKMGFTQIILSSDDTANPKTIYNSYEQYNNNRQKLEDDFDVRENSIY